MHGETVPTSILFVCDHNAVRSPMAEGLARQIAGTSVFVASAGLTGDMEIDGFAVAVCAEMGIELSRHVSRSLEEMDGWGQPIDSFDLVVTLSPAAQRHVLEFTRWYSIDVAYWPTMDPTGIGERREDKLEAYRQTRDQILGNLKILLESN